MAITKATSNAVAAAAKGDLVVGTATNDSDVLAVGSTDQVLTVDSSTATGLKWATPASAIPANSAATVATQQSTTSTSYTDLATSGPAVTVTTGTKALVIITSQVQNDAGNAQAFMSFAVSGATTTAASDTKRLSIETASAIMTASAAYVVTLTAGSNTFTSKYRVGNTAGTVYFQNRNIFVMNLA
jgi:hypothetical protein